MSVLSRAALRPDRTQVIQIYREEAIVSEEDVTSRTAPALTAVPERTLTTADELESRK